MQPRDRGQQIARLLPDLLRVLKVAGIVISDAQVQRLTDRAGPKFREELCNVAALRGECPGSLGILRIVAQ